MDSMDRIEHDARRGHRTGPVDIFLAVLILGLLLAIGILGANG